jgi:hypothetical protein
MTVRAFLRAPAVLLLIAAAESPALLAQTSGRGAALVLRSQAASVAEETWLHVADSSNLPASIALTVEGGSSRQVVENAFLDFLGRRGVRASLLLKSDVSRDGLLLTILEQSVEYRPLPNGEFQREIRTVLEARRTGQPEGSAVYAGLYKRANVDTVARREDVSLRGLRGEEEPTLFDRLLGPILMIGGAFLVVYLFFTVRN